MNKDIQANVTEEQVIREYKEILAVIDNGDRTYKGKTLSECDRKSLKKAASMILINIVNKYNLSPAIYMDLDNIDG